MKLEPFKKECVSKPSDALLEFEFKLTRIDSDAGEIFNAMSIQECRFSTQSLGME